MIQTIHKIRSRHTGESPVLVIGNDAFLRDRLQFKTLIMQKRSCQNDEDLRPEVQFLINRHIPSELLLRSMELHHCIVMMTVRSEMELQHNDLQSMLPLHEYLEDHLDALQYHIDKQERQ